MMQRCVTCCDVCGVCAAVVTELMQHYHSRNARFRELMSLGGFEAKDLNLNDMRHATDRLIWSHAVEMVRTGHSLFWYL